MIYILPKLGSDYTDLLFDGCLEQGRETWLHVKSRYTYIQSAVWAIVSDLMFPIVKQLQLSFLLIWWKGRSEHITRSSSIATQPPEREDLSI